MKKIYLLSFLVAPLLLGGCNNKKIDGPTNDYFHKYSFRRTASKNEGITEDNEIYYQAMMADISHIDEVEEQYRYVDGVEELTTTKTNTEFFTTLNASEINVPYLMESNVSYSYTKTQGSTKSTDAYTSNIIKWQGSYDNIFTVETIKRGETEEKKYDVVIKEPEEAYKELYIKPIGNAYFDRKDHLCYYTQVIENITKEDIDKQTYKYTHREQSIYVYNDDCCLTNYHYYDEVVSNRDPETGKFLDKERIISYKYHETNYRYYDRKLRNPRDLDYLLDGQSLILKVEFIHHINRYRIENGEYNIYKDVTYHNYLDFDTVYDGRGNPTYTAYLDCHDDPAYLGGTVDGLANRLEVVYQRTSGSGALMTAKRNLGYKQDEELLKKYDIDYIENTSGDYFIYTKHYNHPPRIVIRLTIELDNNYKTTIDFDIIERKDG